MLVRGAARQMALLFADIDDFKRVNDTLGHDAGDEVLVQFYNSIRDVMERNDDGNATLARFGGDEFVILMELPDDSELDQVVRAQSGDAVCTCVWISVEDVKRKKKHEKGKRT